MRTKVLCVFGTRPEAIKMAPVVRALAQRRHRFDTQVCVTGQHRAMLDQVLDLFSIAPDYDLDLMRSEQTLVEITTSVLTRLDAVLAKERPHWVLVQGDTTTAMAAALAASYRQVKVGHIEAGLRTWSKHRPFPEEINRKIVDRLADLHFAPTETSRRHLLREGTAAGSVLLTGNTVIDALHWVAAQPFDVATLAAEHVPIGAGRVRLVVVTSHRRENFGPPLENICRAIRQLAECYPDSLHIVYPVHPNPNVHEVVHRMLGAVPNVTLLPPLDYLTFVHLMKHSYLVLTDSGGIQEEAPALGKPALVLRELTERPEAVEAGTVKVVGTETGRIVRETRRLLDDAAEYARMATVANPYGDGQAAQRIVEALSP